MNYDHHDEEDNVLASKDPQVTSLDPEERKAARALRIKRRQDALKLKDLPPEEVVATIQELTPIEQATTEAAIELQKLNWDGAAKVTNVKVTTDEREVERRGALFVKMQQAFRKIEEEAANAQIQYDAITSNWGPMLQIKDPLDIDAAIKEQKVDCDKLLAQKDQLISELKDDLKKVDSAYYMDLKKQDKEIKELSERVEKQTTIMQKAYEKQLALIEKAINIEREAMLDYNNKRWEALNRQRDKEEVAHIDYKFDQLEEHKLNLEEIMWDHCEKYREAKVELETLIQDLQRDLEKLKATCNINTEKIGYTYQVLRKREEENVFVRSQQKRKLNKMSDVANGLRMKIRKAAEEGAAEEIRADAEIVTLMKTMEDFEHKSYHFSRVNDDKFRQVWQMCENQCKSLLKEVRQAEVAIHAHILAEAAPPPLVAPKSILKPDQEESTKGDTGSTHEDEKDAKEKLIEHLLKLVADNTGFLIEDRLIKLIEKKTKTSQKLCTIDSIFMALEIQSAEDIELLLNIFLKYAFCPVCSCFDVDSELYQSMNEPDAVEFVEGRNRESRAMSIRPRASIAHSSSISTSRSAHVTFKGSKLTSNDQMLLAEADEILNKCPDAKENFVSAVYFPQDSALVEKTSLINRRPGVKEVTVTTDVEPSNSSNVYVCPLGHNLEIEPMQVLESLNEFIGVFVPPEKQKLNNILDDLKPPDFTTLSRKLKPADIKKYWACWEEMFSSEKEQFWDGLIHGLNNYLEILQDRERIHEDVVQLRKKNSELHQLVRGVMPKSQPALPNYLTPEPDTFTSALEN